MDRREAISRVAWLLGGTVIGANVFIESGCKSENKVKDVNALFSPENVALLNEIADTILPETSTPGAKAANVGAFIPVMVRDCYEEKDQKVFVDGLDKLQKASDKKNGKDFMKSTPAERTALLVELDKEQKDYMKNKKPD